MGPKAARRAAVISAALAQKSVHWFADDYELVEGEWSIDADVNGDSGRAELNWRAEGDGGEYQLVYVKGMYYVRGDSESLRWFLNLTKAEAARYAGRWISTLNGKRLMFGLTDGLTLPSVARE